jgi:hypothetical protein
LSEEKATDEKPTQLAEAGINQDRSGIAAVDNKSASSPRAQGELHARSALMLC